MPGSMQWRQRWQDGKQFAQEIYQRFGEDRISLAAGAISFFTLLSLFPLTLLALAIAAPWVNAALANPNLREMLGPSFYDALHGQVILTVNHTYRTFSTLVALVFGFWSGSQVFIMLESAVNLAWQAKRRRPYLLRRGLAMLMVIIAGVLLAGALLLANLVRFLASLEIPLWGHRAAELPWLVQAAITIVIPVLLISALFTVIYRILPTKRATVRAVLPGALTAGVLWLVSLHIFGWYTATVSGVHGYRVYGSLTSMILLMFWFYYSAFIFLLGAEISAAYHRRLVDAGNQEERKVEEDVRMVVVKDEPLNYTLHAPQTDEQMAISGHHQDT